MITKWKVNLILLFSIGFYIGLSILSSSADTVDKNTVSNTAKTWKVESQGVHFSLTQLFPDQLRAFYINRGFTLEQAEPFATSCVFMTVLRNDSKESAIHFMRTNWLFKQDDKIFSPKKLSTWLEAFENDKVKKPAQIAFRWAQFPIEQTYEAGGDWNQGMLSVGLPAESKFNIIVRWDMAGKTYESELKGVRCAK